VLKHAQKITDHPILLRLDGGNDSIENIDVLIEHNRKNTDKTPVDFIIKWNPRREKKESWLDYAEQHGRWTSTREGNYALMSNHIHIVAKLCPGSLNTRRQMKYCNAGPAYLKAPLLVQRWLKG
jgi:hypothetical protein